MCNFLSDSRRMHNSLGTGKNMRTQLFRFGAITRTAKCRIAFLVSGLPLAYFRSWCPVAFLVSGLPVSIIKHGFFLLPRTNPQCAAAAGYTGFLLLVRHSYSTSSKTAKKFEEAPLTSSSVVEAAAFYHSHAQFSSFTYF